MSNPALSPDGWMLGWTEAERVAALESYDIVGTAAEPAFDDVVRIAAIVCRTPVALLNLLTADRQWCKANVGFGREVPIEFSICSHAIHEPSVFVVPDLRADSRFANNPLVIHEPYIKFYAGSLLVTPGGLPLGTVCVLDFAPRHGITFEQAEVLMMLARQAMLLLENRRSLRRVADEARRRDSRAPGLQSPEI